MKSAARHHNLVLIGMPGAGKTTVGRSLAQRLNIEFIDTDLLMERHAGEPLQRQLERLGYADMRKEEEHFVASCELPLRAVVATGGSVVYGPLAMERLHLYGICAYLEISLSTIMQRVDNWQERGFSCAPGQTLAQVYEERLPLYRRYADLTVQCDHLTMGQVVPVLEQHWREQGSSP